MAPSAVLRKVPAPALLDSYERERRPLALRNTGYARGFADSAIHHQILRAFGHVRIEVVLNHAVCRFNQPVGAVQFITARRTDFTGNSLSQSFAHHRFLN